MGSEMCIRDREIEDKIRASHGLDFDMPKPEAEAAAAEDSDDVLES